jgi:hypothetical protein
MSTLNNFHQGLWKLPVLMSLNSNSESDNNLRKSIGEKNDKVVDLSPKKFWTVVSQPAGSGEKSCVVVLCGDLIRDRVGDNTVLLYIQRMFKLICSEYFTQILSALPEVHISNAKIQLRNELGTLAEISLPVYLKMGITALFENNECTLENDDQNETQCIQKNDKVYTTLVSSWKRSVWLNK